MAQLTSMRLFAAALFCTLLAGCSGQGGSGQCEVKGQNFVVDPLFASFDKPRRERKWHVSEHSARRSFAYEVVDTALEIEWLGPEPWAMVTQGADADALAGKTVLYSAELKLDLAPQSEVSQLTPGGGLLLSAKRNNRSLLDSVMEHEPHLGSSDWVTVGVVLDIPPDASYVQLGFIHQAAGTMQVRNPSLRELADREAGCPDFVVGDG